MIESYSQIPLVFYCKSWVNDDHKIWTKNYNLAKIEINPIESIYEYTAIFFFDPNAIKDEAGGDGHKI